MKRNYFKIMLAAMALMMSGSAMAQDETFEAGGLRYKLTEDGGCQVIPAEYGQSYTGDVVIPETVSNNGNDYAVTSVGDGAFYLAPITSVKIGKNVRYVGDRAFQGAGFTKVSIPANVDSLAAFAFDCELWDLTIEDGDTPIKYSGWGHIRVDSIRTAYVGRTFVGDQLNLGYKVKSVTFGPKVKTVPFQICYGCKDLTHLDLGTGVKIISEDAFGGNYALEDIIIPDQVEEIRGGAFYGCSAAQNVYFGKSVKFLGQNAFTGMAEKVGEIETLRFPASIDSIGRNCIITNAAIKNIIFEDGPNPIRFHEVWPPISAEKTENIYLGRQIYTEDRQSQFSVGFDNYLKHVTYGPYVQHIPAPFADYIKSIQDITCLGEVPPAVDAHVFCIEQGDKAYRIYEQATLIVPEEYDQAYRNADFWRYFYKRETFSSINAIQTDTRNAKTYNLQGQAVGEDYKGIVIQGGKKFLKK